MNLKIYEYLLAIEKEGSLTKAAEKMYISQPAMTQLLHRYEKQWGVTVFRKTKEGLLPTKEGRIVLNTAAQVLSVTRNAEEDIQALKRSSVTELRIYIEYSMYNMFLRDIWPKVIAVYPDLKLNLTAGDSRNGAALLEDNFCDLAVISAHDEFPMTSFAGRIFGKQEYLLTGSSGAFRKEDLLRMVSHPEKAVPQIFVLKKSYSLSPSFQESALQETHLKVSEITYASTFQNAARQAASGSSLSILPDLIFSILDLPVVNVSLQHPYYVSDIIAWKKDQEKNPVCMLIADLLTEHCISLRARLG